MNTSTSKIYYPQLDALRGIAALLVLLYHYFSFPLGWMGVDLFFVLSGFLITNNLITYKGSKNFLKRFYLRRILRIFPVYFIVLMVFYVLAMYLFSETSTGSVFHYYTTHQLWFWTFASNWLFIREGIPPVPYLQHLWSLAIEEQFYLVWPFFMLMVPSVHTLRQFLICFFAISLITRVILYYNGSGFQEFYYNTLARLDSFSSGAFLSVLIHLKKSIGSTFKKSIAFIFVASITSAYVIYGHAKIHNPIFATIGYSINALFFTMLCHHFIASSKYVARSAPLKRIGKISYGLYIYHLPVFLVVSYLLGRYDIRGFSMLNSLLSTIVTFIVSSLSYRWVELPLLRLKTNIT